MNRPRWIGRLAGAVLPGGPAAARPDDTYEGAFADFLEHTRGVSQEAARRLIADSQAVFRGGWAGADYREFTERALEVLRPLHGEGSARELFETYRIHAPFDFLRMLSYPIPSRAELADLVRHLAASSRVAIVDYGCGLAQRSIALAGALRERGADVQITLVDIRRPTHAAFLAFVCGRRGLSYEFIEVTPDQPYPALPPHQYCDVNNVLEHILEPLRVIDNVHASLGTGGLLLASVADQAAEMMHVTPNLAAVRDRLAELGYRRRGAYFGATLFDRAADG